MSSDQLAQYRFQEYQIKHKSKYCNGTMSPIYLKLMYLQFIFALILSTSSAFLCGHLTRNPRGVHLSISTSTSEEEVDVHDLQLELNTEDLNLCHGILHSSGVRELSDIQYLTEEQIDDMGIDAFDKRNIVRVKEKFSRISGRGVGGKIIRELSTNRYGKCYFDSFLAFLNHMTYYSNN